MVSRVYTRFIFVVWLLVLFLASGTPVHAATISAKTDRMNITIDESFTLMFIVEGDIDKAPNFAPLKKDFDILSQSQGSTVSINNGYYKNASTYSLTLMAKRAGNLIIPAIAFGKDSSQLLAISVGAGTTTPVQPTNLILEVTPSRSKTWVQGQIILSVKLLSAMNLRQYHVSNIDLGQFDASIEKLGEATQSQTTRDGRNYLVIEQKFSIHPQQSGLLTIEPFVAEVDPMTQPRSLFDQFNTRSTIVRARSKSIAINVLDIPAEFKGKSWLPATDVQLVEEWSPSPPVFKVGEPVTRTLNLFADGLTAAQLPELHGGEITGIKQYPDQPVLNNDKNSGGIIGGRREKIALIPTHTGNFTLPAIEVTWWNINTGKTETARIEEKTIEVLPGVATSPTNLPNIPTTEENVSAADVDGIKSVLPGAGPHALIWLSVFFATGWLLTSAAWWYSTVKKNPRVPRRKKPETTGSAHKTAIRQACENNNAHDCRTALLNWAKQSMSPDINSLGDIIHHSSVQQHKALVHELDLLNAALYRSHNPAWQGQNLWAALQTLTPPRTTGKKIPAKSTLEPLYK